MHINRTKTHKRFKRTLVVVRQHKTYTGVQSNPFLRHKTRNTLTNDDNVKTVYLSGSRCTLQDILALAQTRQADSCHEFITIFTALFVCFVPEKIHSYSENMRLFCWSYLINISVLLNFFESTDIRVVTAGNIFQLYRLRTKYMGCVCVCVCV